MYCVTIDLDTELQLFISKKSITYFKMNDPFMYDAFMNVHLCYAMANWYCVI